MKVLLFIIVIISLSIITINGYNNQRFMKMSLKTNNNPTNTGSKPNIDILARDIDLTSSLQDRVNSKIGKVISKLGERIRSAQVTLRVHKFPSTEMHHHTTKKNSQIAEVTLNMKGGLTINASERTEDLYASIDLVSHKLAQALKKHNEKIYEKKTIDKESLFYDESSEVVTGNDETFDEEELLLDLDNKYKNVNQIDPYKTDLSVVKPKVFDMKPISLEEAVLCLQFVDHPFYVFRNRVNKLKYITI